jgi:hypothetical protein
MTLDRSTISQVKAMLTEMAAESAELKAAAGGSLMDVAADWVVPQYVLAVREQLAVLPAGPERLKVLRLAANDLAALRRGDLGAARLVLDRERLAFDRICVERAKNAEFWKWTKQPDIRRKLWPRKQNGLSEKTIGKIERELKLV